MERRAHKSRLALLNLITIILAFATGALFLYTHSLSGQVENLTRNNHALTHYATQIVEASNYLTSEVRAYVVTQDRAHYDNYWNEVNNARRSEEAVEELRRIGITPEEDAIIAEMLSISNALIPIEEKAMSWIDIAPQTAVFAIYGEEYEQAVNQISAMQQQFVRDLENRIEQEEAALYHMQRIAMLEATACLTAIVAIQIINALFVRRRLLLPIAQVKEEMDRIKAGSLSQELAITSGSSEIGLVIQGIVQTKAALRIYIEDISALLSALADGDMTAESHIHYEGDFAPIEQSISKILHSLNQILTEIDNAANQVAVGASQLSTSASALAQGASEQAGAIATLSAAVDDIAHQVSSATVLTQEISVQTASVEAEMHSSNLAMDDMVEAMGEIQQASSQIQQIVHTINDIAFQTNILALNAAVEAARAGTQGQGFAVVAQEIRRLATSSSQAVSETTSFIEQNLRAVSKGVQAVQASAAPLKNAAGAVQNLLHATEEVSASAQAVAGRVGEINAGMHQIAQVVSSNSATAEESASSSEELSAQSVQLKTLVGRFRLRRFTQAESTVEQLDHNAMKL